MTARKAIRYLSCHCHYGDDNLTIIMCEYHRRLLAKGVTAAEAALRIEHAKSCGELVCEFLEEGNKGAANICFGLANSFLKPIDRCLVIDRCESGQDYTFEVVPVEEFRDARIRGLFSGSKGK